MTPDNGERDPYRVMRLILELRQVGITDIRLLNAVERLSRDEFIPDGLQEYAYDDVALPIACGQTISRPSTVIGMVNELELGEKKSLKVLEIGTGSGYMTALLAALARRVYSVERYRTLADTAKKRFETLSLSNIVSQCADGSLGWVASAPFDRIVSTCAVEEIPEIWVKQVKPGGFMILPIGTNEEQFLMKIGVGEDGKTTSTRLWPSKFLHLVDGVAKEL